MEAKYVNGRKETREHHPIDKLNIVLCTANAVDNVTCDRAYLHNDMGVEENLEPFSTFDSVGHPNYDYPNRHQETNGSPEKECMECDLK